MRLFLGERFREGDSPASEETLIIDCRWTSEGAVGSDMRRNGRYDAGLAGDEPRGTGGPSVSGNATDVGAG